MKNGDDKLLLEMFRRMVATGSFSERCCGDDVETVGLEAKVKLDKTEQGAWHRLISDISIKGDWANASRTL